MAFISLQNYVCNAFNVHGEHSKGVQLSECIFEGITSQCLDALNEALAKFGVQNLASVYGHKRTNMRVNLRNYKRVHVKKFRNSLHGKI